MRVVRGTLGMRVVRGTLGMRVVRGTLGMRVDGVESRAEAGTRVVVPPATPHDWWNVGGDTTWVIIEVIPGRRFEAMIRNLFGLAADGRTDRNGRPGLLQTALFAREFDDTVQFTSPPLAVQRTLCAVAPLARLRGLHGRYREYEQRTGPASTSFKSCRPISPRYSPRCNRGVAHPIKVG